MGGLQGIELVLGVHHGLQGCGDGGIQGQAEGLVAVIAVVRGVDGGRGPGGGFHDGEHGAGHRVAQRGPGPDLGAVQRRGQQRRADPGVPGQRFGGGAQEDGEQRSRVAAGLFHGGLAGPGQDGADVVVCRPGGPGRLHRRVRADPRHGGSVRHCVVQCVGRGADGQVEVGAGVAVGYGKDVDGVQAVAVVAERGFRLAQPPLHRMRVGGNFSLQSDPIPQRQRACPRCSRPCFALVQGPLPSLSQ